MQTYIGVKIVSAEPAPCQKDDYKSKVGDPGYNIQYDDGYISWCPKKQFEGANRPINGMTFGMAIEAMKKGYKVSRNGWNGKDMWIVYMSGMELPPFNTQNTSRKVNDRTAKLIGEDTPLSTLPYIAMWTADKKWLPGWLASQTDMLADDYFVVYERIREVKKKEEAINE